SVRQVKRLLVALKKRGDKVVIHGLRGQPSKRKIDEKMQRQAMKILSGEEYRGFGPTLASEELARRHKIVASRETVRKWMMAEKLWRAGKRKIEQIHVMRPRRSRFGELVQWDTSDHDWLEGRGERLYLIGMVDDATSRALARFVESDSTLANMEALEMWLQRHGRMLGCYTDKASHFQSAQKIQRDEPNCGKDGKALPPTQIARALGELNITWIPAHSPQAKGRIERFFETAQDRLVKGMRLAGVRTLAEANRYLEKEYLPWWNRNCTVVPASADDAHRQLEAQHDLAAILSHVETRQVKSDYTLQYEGKIYAIERVEIVTGLRGSVVRVEQRRDGQLAIRFRDQYLRYQQCEPAQKAVQPKVRKPVSGSRQAANAGGKSRWMKDFMNRPGPPIHKAIKIANATS
ncbi:MAG TPA: ISNCY family transposase, partial [Bryobacteraceae bacterium]|nr:ISNCY family transposase [Bryobacteraceae bacterium]